MAKIHSEIGRTSIDEYVRMRLWAVSGGRCEMCNRLLYQDLVFGYDANFGEMAHIHAVSENGPRHKYGMSKDEKNNIDNLMFGNIESSQVHKDYFEVVMNITLSENSATYKVKISYRMGYRPKAVLLSPGLAKRDDKYPHHIYGFDKAGHAILCVYCPHKSEWSSSMPIATSFIPWVSTWLNTYEYWMITGEWHYDEVVNHTGIKE